MKFEEHKSYGTLFTNDFFQTRMSLSYATKTPLMDTIKIAFADVKGIVYELTFPIDKKAEFERIKKILDEVQIILFGTITSPLFLETCKKYKVSFTKSKKRNEIGTYKNIHNITDKLWDIFRDINDMAREQELFNKEPLIEEEFGPQ